MSVEHHLDVHRLLHQAENLEDGASKVALLEEAARFADAANEIGLGYTVRDQLIRAATFGGYPEKALVAFTWCLAQSDRNPDQYHESELLWPYKWIMGSMAGFPQVSRQQIETMLDDMNRRFRNCGTSPRPVYNLRCKIAISMGDASVAQAAYRKWQAAKLDYYSDCPACECNSQFKYLLYRKQLKRALSLAKPIFEGHLHCAEVPHATFALALVPLVCAGRAAEAMPMHKKGYRLIARNHEFIIESAKHITFLVLTDNHARALRLFEKHLPWALEALDLSRQFEFFLSSQLLLAQLGKSGKESVSLRLPKTFPMHQPSGRYAVDVLGGWFASALADMAKRFDDRNGNEWFTRQIEDNWALEKWITPVPVR